MRHSKIFKREDGTKIMIDVSLTIDHHKYYWNVYVSKCEPRKRTFVGLVRDDYQYRRLDMNARRTYEMDVYLLFCEMKEINQVKKELIDSIEL